MNVNFKQIIALLFLFIAPQSIKCMMGSCEEIRKELLKEPYADSLVQAHLQKVAAAELMVQDKYAEFIADNFLRFLFRYPKFALFFENSLLQHFSSLLKDKLLRKGYFGGWSQIITQLMDERRLEHPKPITAFNLIIRSDKDYIITSASDKILRIWDPANGKRLAAVPQHHRVLSIAQFDEDSFITVNEVKHDFLELSICDIHSGKCFKVITQNLFTKLGEAKAACAEGSIIKILDLKTEGILKTLEGHSAHIRILGALDNETLISMAEDNNNNKTVRVWDVPSGKCIKVIILHAWPDKFERKNYKWATPFGTRGTVVISFDSANATLNQLLRKAQGAFCLSPVLKSHLENSKQIEHVNLDLDPILTQDLFILMLQQLAFDGVEQFDKGITFIQLVKVISSLMAKHNGDSTSVDERIAYLYQLLKQAHQLELSLIESALSYSLTTVSSSIDPHYWSGLMKNLKEYGLLAIETSDKSTFLLDQQFISDSPVLKAVINSNFIEGKGNIIRLTEQFDSSTVSILKKLLLIYRKAKVLEGKDGGNISHELYKYLATLGKQIPYEVIALAHQWMLPQIAQIVTHHIVQRLNNSEIERLVNEYPDCHLYLAPELEPSCSLLLWQIEQHTLAIELKYIINPKIIAIKYANFIFKNRERLIKLYPDIAKTLANSRMPFLTQELRQRADEARLNDIFVIPK